MNPSNVDADVLLMLEELHTKLGTLP